MKIAIDISPLSSGHKVRGVGFYLMHLKNALEKYYPENSYIFFKNKNEIPSDIDVVHYPYFDPFSITLPLIKKYKIVATIHDLTPIVFAKHFPSGVKGKLKWEINKVLLRNIDGIITDSNSSTKDVIKYIGINKERVKTVYLAAGERFTKIKNNNEKKDIKKKYNLPEKFALYVGDVTWNKNLPRIIEAAIKTKIPLVMVGKSLVNENYDRTNVWNNDVIRVQTLAKKNSNIIRVGFVPDDDLVDFYNSATCLMMPSLYEGFGLPILEAMSCGCPVITSKEGSLLEVSGNAALYVNAYDVTDISKKMQLIFTDVKLQKELVEKGLKRACEFSWKKSAQETIEAYKNVLRTF